jgi:hypothetical protein
LPKRTHAALAASCPNAIVGAGSPSSRTAAFGIVFAR